MIDEWEDKIDDSNFKDFWNVSNFNKIRYFWQKYDQFLVLNKTILNPDEILTKLFTSLLPDLLFFAVLPTFMRKMS